MITAFTSGFSEKPQKIQWNKELLEPVLWSEAYCVSDSCCVLKTCL